MSTTPQTRPPTGPSTLLPTKPSTTPPTEPPITTTNQFIENVVDPEKINRTVLVNVVINEEYNEKYDNKSSREYKEFVGNFTKQMNKYYEDNKIANFQEVVVISVSRGEPLVRFSNNTVEEIKLWGKAMAIYSITQRAKGVNVTHDVVLRIPNNASHNQLYTEDYEAVKDALDALVNCTGECPDFNVTAQPTVNKTSADFGSVCEKFVEDPDVAQYYESVELDGKIVCVTACRSQHSHYKRCYNNGKCTVYKDIGPLCRCPNVESTWYLSDDCSLPIQRTAFYAGLSVTFACLLVVVGVLTAFLLRNKQRQKRKRDIKVQLVNQWLTEDFEWSRSNSDIHNAGDYNNPSYANDESAIHREDSSVYRQPVLYELNRPSSDTDDRQSNPSAIINGLETEYSLSDPPYRHNTLTTTLSFSNAGHQQPASPALHHRGLSSNQPMRIGRPQRRTSWDA
ncbi:mucin-17-like [Thunnus maccoyii]|uniref:mucin-17-like n=1 Tax=Thunnus maccoyii TaxID=8240 RepID=UPI001C4D847D|nr:mucin-17-like [Thunnus maccoyii]